MAADDAVPTRTSPEPDAAPSDAPSQEWRELEDAAREGVLLVVCGPSGVGKTSLSRELRARRERLGVSVSVTTRAPREGEVDGVHYNFVDPQRFRELRDRGYFAEWAEVHGHHYGTPVSEIREAFDDDRDLIFDIDVQGAHQLQNRFPGAVAVLVVPPDMETLERRLRGRGTDPDEVIERRLAAARDEMSHWRSFDYIVVNDEFDVALDRMTAIYDASRSARRVRAAHMRALLD